MKKLYCLLPTSDSAVCTVISELKLEDDDDDKTLASRSAGDGTWVKYENYSLSFDDLNILCSGRNLTDKHINLGQQLIKEHHPNIVGLKSTLFIQKQSYCYSEVERQNHFIHLDARGNSGHWIVVSNIGGEVAEVTVYDSLNNTVSNYTTNLLKRLLKNSSIKIFVVRPQIQSSIKIQ